MILVKKLAFPEKKQNIKEEFLQDFDIFLIFNKILIVQRKYTN